MHKREDNFTEYREFYVEKRKEHIRSALRILVNSQYKNITRLAIDVAKIVTEMELKDYEIHKAKDLLSEESSPKKMSKTTLLRNNDYRVILEAHLLQQEEKTIENSGNAVSEVEILKARIAALVTQNEVLKNKIAVIDPSHLALQGSVNHVDQKDIEKLKDDKVFLVYMVEKIMNHASDIFIHKPDGMHAYDGKKIFDISELKHWEDMINSDK